MARRTDGLVPSGQIRGARLAHPGVTAPARGPVVRVLHPRPRHHLCQGRVEARRHPQLRRPRRPEMERQGLHALFGKHVQPFADEFADRAPGRTQGRSLGQRRRGQLRARAQGRRHRPDQGARFGRMRPQHRQHLLLRAHAEGDQAGRENRDRQGRHGVAQPGRARRARQHLRRRPDEIGPEPRGRRQVPRVPCERRCAALLRQRQQ